MTNLNDILHNRIHLGEIKRLSAACTGPGSEAVKAEIFRLAGDADERIAYNALWVFTHLPSAERQWLLPHRNELIDRLLGTRHAGLQRLLLTLLQSLPTTEADVRTDYLDFCLTHINSCAPYAIRAFSLKQSYEMCRFFPELLHELKGEMDMMADGEMSPGLRSALRQVNKRMKGLEKGRKSTLTEHED